MECINLYTAAEIIEAFDLCNNSRKQIELFKCLATRKNSPLEALVELVKTNKQEPVLALSIQALGQIADVDLNEQLKQDTDLLEILNWQAQSGSSDLICWAAATTIECVRFNSLVGSQDRIQKIQNIAENIMQSKVKRFDDRTLVNSSDYQEFVRFWLYGPLDKLREVTAGYEFWGLWNEWQSKKERGWHDSPDREEVERLNKFSVCWEVMNALDLEGLQNWLRNYQDFRGRINQIRSINLQLYEKISSLEDTRIMHLLLDDKDRLISEELNELRTIVNEFYSPDLKYINKVSVNLKSKIKKLRIILFKVNQGVSLLGLGFLVLFLVLHLVDLSWKIILLITVAILYLISLKVLIHYIKENEKKLEQLSRQMNHFYGEINQLTRILWH